MKKTSKLLALLLAFVMVLGVVAPIAKAASEAETKADGFTTKVILTKVGMTSLEGFPKEHDGKEITDLTGYFGTGAKVLQGVAFDIYKINDDGTEELVDTILTDTKGQISPELLNGTYRFEENKEKSTYVGPNGETLSDFAAVPFTVTLPLVDVDGTYFDSVDKPLYVYPKNTEVGMPDVTKEEDTNAETPATGGDVTKGDVVPYVVNTTIKAGSTYKQVAWNDRMSAGLTFNEDLELTTSPDLGLELGTDYTVSYSDNGFVVDLTDAGLIKLGQQTAPTGESVYKIGETDIIGKNVNVTFTLKYSATVNEDAIVENALENTVTFEYGNAPGFTPLPGDKNPIPQTDKTDITVNKSFVSGNAMETEEAWPENMTINLKLEVYNPATNLWEDTGNTLPLNSTTTSVTFTGLDATKTYRVVEVEVDGWVPNYSLDERGNLVIKNRENPNNPNPITPDPVIVRTFGKKFVKVDSKDQSKLPGAEFVIKNSEDEFLTLKDDVTMKAEYDDYLEAERAYVAAVNAATTENPNTEAIATAKATRDEAYKAMSTSWTWGTDQAAAYIVISGPNGEFEITGLEAGTYYLVETKEPDGYAKLTSPVEFNVGPGTYAADPQVIENMKVTIPQTGGIGTIIFTVAGLAIMAGAAFVLIKNNKKEEIA